MSDSETEKAPDDTTLHIGRHAVDTCSGCMDVLQKDILGQLEFERRRADKAIVESIALGHIIGTSREQMMVFCSLCDAELLSWTSEAPDKEYVRATCWNHLVVCERNPQNDTIAALTAEVEQLRAGAWYCEFCDTEQPRDLTKEEAAKHFLKFKGISEYLTVGPPKKKGKEK